MKVRRIVTGHDASGKAIVWKDAEIVGGPSRADRIETTLMWATDSVPFDYLRDEDMATRKLGIAPPEGGTRFSVIEIQPGNAAYMHRTDSIDYVICLAGEIEMDMDSGSSVKMKAGEIMIQRGTSHAWANRSNVPCRLAVVLIDGEPKR